MTEFLYYLFVIHIDKRMACHIISLWSFKWCIEHTFANFFKKKHQLMPILLCDRTEMRSLHTCVRKAFRWSLSIKTKSMETKKFLLRSCRRVWLHFLLCFHFICICNENWGKSWKWSVTVAGPAMASSQYPSMVSLHIMNFCEESKLFQSSGNPS